MGKSIKKIYKILIIFLLVLTTIPITAYFVLKNSKVQTYLTQKIIAEVSKNTDAKFDIKSVHFRFFNKLVLKDVYIEDNLQDTLLFSKEIICHISKVNRTQKFINIKRVNLINAKFYLHKFDTINPINLTYLIRSSKKDTIKKESQWKIVVQNVEMQQSVFKYKSIRKREKEYGINFNDLVCYIDELDVRDLKIEDGIVNLTARKLKVTEKSGFLTYSTKFNMSIGNDHMIFRNVKIRTPHSYINADSVCFFHNDFDDYNEFAKNIRLDFGLQESNVSFKDIGYFASIFKDIPLNTVISGRVYSKLSTFKGKDVKFQIGEQTELITDFNLNGLPDYSQMFIYVDFKKLTTWAKDFELINTFIKKGKKITIPDSFDKLGIINYKGNFAGFFDDFVTYGKFTTKLGNVSTDLSLQPDTSKILSFDGNIQTTSFQLGELTGDTSIIGSISANANIKGFTQNKSIKAQTEGVVNQIEINKYNYQNIKFDGFLTEKTYDGIFSITDPNIQLNFSGGIDFSKEIPVFNFYADVPRAQLYKLNVDKKDSTSNISFDLAANFSGVDIDNINGDIKFSNAKLVKFNEEMNFDTLMLAAEHDAELHSIILKSDYIDATLKGSYKSSTIIKSLKQLYYNYLPNLTKQPEDTIQIDYNNDFSLDVNLKQTHIISRFFIPSVFISDNSFLNFQYSNNDKRFLLNASFNKLQYKHHTFNDLIINTYSNDSLFTTVTKCSDFLFNNYFTLDNFKTTSLVHHNNIDIKIDWNNYDTLNYQGKILASTKINQEETFGDQSYKITLLPSEFIVKDSLWMINKSIISIDSTSVDFIDFTVSHGDQHFAVFGKISENPSDTLYVQFDDLNLANLNIITAKNKLEFEGNINGKANISNIYNEPLFFSDIEIDKLVLNKETFGYTKILSQWIDDQKAIGMDVSAQYAQKEIIKANGFYFPKSNLLDFEISIDQLHTHVLTPYLSSFASEITGTANGYAKVTGALQKPVFNGSIELIDTKMTIDYIKTPYYFNTNAEIDNNSIVFTNTEVYDSFQNIALTNGFVKFGPDKNISFNFNINAEKVHALNTTGSDNDAFYGTAFMTGIVNIIGDKDETLLDILGITEQNTKINIPLTHMQSAEESGFITFVNAQKVIEQDITDFNTNTSGFKLNFDLEVTPDAEAQLIFDSKIGDVIRGKGAGNIKMEIDDDQEFEMYGEYIIEEGDYLFTLQNVINKRFKIERGGNIIWNGAPYDATVDISAAYNLKTSLSGLVDSSLYQTNDFYKKRIPVKCQVFLTERLLNPSIEFNIDLPTADEETKTLVRSLINTEEKKNKQFLSLLVLNTFMPEQTTDNYLTNSASTANLGSVTTSELLSNQLSHWLSQISDEWDIGVNYRPGDEISKDQVEVALSTQLLNDRVSINGNVGYGGQTEAQASDIVGDFNVDVKLNKSGKIRVKAFNESNDKLIYEDAPYTQGVGIFYREEFNSFSELLRNFWHKFSKKEKDTND